MKKIVLGLMLLCGATAIEAQNEVETTICGDVVSSYIWRGQDLGHVSLQPTLGVGYKGLSLTAWGSVGLTDPAVGFVGSAVPSSILWRPKFE